MPDLSHREIEALIRFHQDGLVQYQMQMSPSAQVLEEQTIQALNQLLESHKNETQTIALTSRERQVYELIKRGLTNKEIAAKLFISFRTVEIHVRNIYAKTGTSINGRINRRYLLPDLKTK